MLLFRFAANRCLYPKLVMNCGEAAIPIGQKTILIGHFATQKTILIGHF